MLHGSYTKVLLLLLAISMFVEVNGETFNCNTTDACGWRVSCLNSNEDCIVYCDAANACQGMEVFVAESESNLLDIRCRASYACESIIVLSYRTGSIVCNTAAGGSIDPCAYADVTIMNKKANSNNSPLVDCYADACEAYFRFSCQDPTLCTWNCRGNGGCSSGTFAYYCKDATTCDLTGHTNAWSGATALIYCDPIQQTGGYCSDPPGYTGWIYGGTLDPTSSPTTAPTSAPTLAPALPSTLPPTIPPVPTSTPTMTPTMAPVPTSDPTVAPTNAPFGIVFVLNIILSLIGKKNVT